MTRSLIHAAACLLALALMVPEAAAQGAGAERRWPIWQLQWENDAFAVGSTADEHYTNGVRFSLAGNPNFNPDPVDEFAGWWCKKFCTREPNLASFGFAFGQNLYTPEDITVVALIPDDRPYAALLYGSLFVTLLNRSATTQQTIELQLGFVGPEAGGEFVQRTVHDWGFSSRTPMGWHNQIGFEPALNLNYQLGRRLVLAGDPNAATADFVPHWGLGLGNVMTRASGGGTLRFGKNISGFPQPDIVNTIGGGSVESFAGGGVAAGRADFEAYAFLGIEGRAVAHNIFLDGNSFRASHRVDKRNEVFDLRAGLFLRWKSWQLNYTFVRRSQEFDPTRGKYNGRHDFGSVTIGRVLPLMK